MVEKKSKLLNHIAMPAVMHIKAILIFARNEFCPSLTNVKIQQQQPPLL